MRIACVDRPQGSHLKVNNVTDVLKSSKAYFGWHTQLIVAATTTFSGTGFPYYMHHSSQYHSNLAMTLSSCVFLTLQSDLNQKFICQPSSSYCQISMILDTLKNELKPPFTANITEVFLLHVDKNGGHCCEQNLYNGNKKGEHSCCRFPMETT